MELVEVRVRGCACPGSPHAEGDTVSLLPQLSIEGGAAAELDLVEVMNAAKEGDSREASYAKLLVRWTATFVRYGAVSWNWLQTGKDGPEPVPFDVELLVNDYSLARLVAGRANDLYQKAALDPLLEAAAPNRQQRRSRRTSTGTERSRTRGKTRTPPASSSEPGSDGPPLRIAR
jgi:hypothetical protein